MYYIFTSNNKIIPLILENTSFLELYDRNRSIYETSSINFFHTYDRKILIKDIEYSIKYPTINVLKDETYEIVLDTMYSEIIDNIKFREYLIYILYDYLDPKPNGSMDTLEVLKYETDIKLISDDEWNRLLRMHRELITQDDISKLKNYMFSHYGYYLMNLKHDEYGYIEFKEEYYDVVLHIITHVYRDLNSKHIISRDNVLLPIEQTKIAISNGLLIDSIIELISIVCLIPIDDVKTICSIRYNSDYCKMLEEFGRINNMNLLCLLIQDSKSYRYVHSRLIVQ